jgi:hypothetical protein
MQIGFTNLDGCKVNINLLGKALICLRADSGGVITIVDIAKAFDTIPHAALKQCLQRKSVLERSRAIWDLNTMTVGPLLGWGAVTALRSS